MQNEVLKMKIGIGLGSHSRWGDYRYKKLKEHGYSCIDFNMMDTNHFPYTDSLKETENTYDLALEGKGFFSISFANKNSGEEIIKYTME